MSDYLPEEVVLKILQRLPVKSLIRFRCVSKSWNSLITTSAFINSHLTRSLPKSSNKLIVRHCVDSPHVEHYKLIDNNNDSSSDQIQHIDFPLTSRRINHFLLIGSANGLFSLFEQDRFVLWNPSIRKFITLPKSCITVKKYGRVTCRSAFGFDPRTNDYKVVRIAFQCRTDTSEEAKIPIVEVYSLSEGSWRITSAGDSFSPGISFQDWGQPSASLNGAVHFVAMDRDNKWCPLVSSFDLGDEVFREMSVPNGALTGIDYFHTSVIGGSLSLLCHDTHKATVNKFCSIWVMKEYGVVDSWTKLFTVNLNGGLLRVLGLQKNGNILVEAKLPHYLGIASYEPKSEQIKNLGIGGRPYYFCVDNYMENLVLLDKPNDVVSKRGASRKRKCRLTSDEEQRVHLLQKARHQLRETIQEEESLCQQLQPIIHQQETILHQLETILMTLQEAMIHDERECQPQEASLCQQETLLQQRMDKIASLISKVEKMDTVKSEWVFIIQQLRGQVITSAEEETILQQKMEKMTSLKSQLERMATIKSKVVFLIQQFRGQAGDMSSGAGDQSSTQVQQRSSSAGQEM